MALPAVSGSEIQCEDHAAAWLPVYASSYSSCSVVYELQRRAAVTAAWRAGGMQAVIAEAERSWKAGQAVALPARRARTSDTTQGLAT
jgi:hypothetical protein